jgi:predicted O-methyltransferase YrrM
LEHYFRETIGEQPEGWFTYPRLYTELVQKIPNNGIFVEVGSWKGKSIVYFAVEAINSNKNIKIYAVDNWLGDENHINDPDVVQSTLYSTFLQNIKKVDHIITPIRGDSAQSAQLFQDQSVDACFIDACHEYEYVKTDILAWYPKIKSGGIICGHDYMWFHERPGGPPVKKAVDEVLGSYNIEYTGMCENCWKVVKR